MVIQILFLGILLFIAVLVATKAFLPSYKDKPSILLLKKIDLILQHILVGLNLLCLVSVIFWMMFIVLLPLLGLVQLFSLAYHAYFKELTAYHITYLKVLAISSVAFIFTILLLPSYTYISTYIVLLILFGLSIEIYYWIISIKTRNSVSVLADESSEAQ